MNRERDAAMIIEKFSGVEPRLYALVAPLVMSVPVIRQNNNYPFKTSRKHVWFVVRDKSGVQGFVPVERRTSYALVDNYYVAGDSSDLLTTLVGKAVDEFARECPLYAMVHMRHAELFAACGFVEVKCRKLYVKMKYEGNEQSQA